MRSRLFRFRTWRGLRLRARRSCHLKWNRGSRGAIGIEGFDLPFLDAEDVGLAGLSHPPRWNSDFVGIRPSPGCLEVGVGGRNESIQFRQLGSAANGELV